MPSTEGTLLVLPNPYAHLDARGRPSAAFAFEGMSGRDRYVGAQIDHARTKKLGRVVFVPAGYDPPKGAGEAHLMAAWACLQPLAVPDTSYYRRALAHGDLLPATDEVRKLVGLPDKTPVGDAALESARKAASERFQAAYGTAPAFEAAAPDDKAEPTTTEGVPTPTADRARPARKETAP